MTSSMRATRSGAIATPLLHAWWLSGFCMCQGGLQIGDGPVDQILVDLGEQFCLEPVPVVAAQFAQSPRRSDDHEILDMTLRRLVVQPVRERGEKAVLADEFVVRIGGA